jgi:hypothetical protein
MLRVCSAYHDHLLLAHQVWQWFVAHNLDPHINGSTFARFLMLCGGA